MLLGKSNVLTILSYGKIPNDEIFLYYLLSKTSYKLKYQKKLTFPISPLDYFYGVNFRHVKGALKKAVIPRPLHIYQGFPAYTNSYLKSILLCRYI